MPHSKVTNPGTRVKVSLEQMKEITSKPSSAKKPSAPKIANRRLATGDRRSKVRGGYSTKTPSKLEVGRRAGDIALREQAKKSWYGHYKSGKPMSEWERPSTAQRASKYFKGLSGERGLIESDRPRYTPHGTPGAGMKAAQGYLSKRAAVANIGQVTKTSAGKAMLKGAMRGLGRAAGTIGTAAELSSAVFQIQKARMEEQEAKLGTAMIKSGMKSAKLKKELGKTSREGVPGNIKVN